MQTLHPTAAEYIIFSSAQGTLSQIDDMLGHNQVLINLRRKGQKDITTDF